MAEEEIPGLGSQDQDPVVGTPREVTPKETIPERDPGNAEGSGLPGPAAPAPFGVGDTSGVPRAGRVPPVLEGSAAGSVSEPGFPERLRHRPGPISFNSL